MHFDFDKCRSKLNLTIDQKYYRIILLAAPILYILFGVLFKFMDSYTDPLSFYDRAFDASLFLLVWVLSFFIKWVEEHLKHLTLLVAYISITHLGYIAYTVDYSFNVAISILLVITFINLVLKSKNSLLYFNIIFSIFLGVSLWSIGPIDFSKVLYFIIYLFMSSLTYFINYQKITTENEIIKNKAKLDLAISGADLGLWAWNYSTGEMTFNKNWAEMLEYEFGSLEEKVSSWKSLIHPEEKMAVLRKIDTFINGTDEILKFEHRLKTKTGEYKWIRMIMKAHDRDNRNKPKRIVGMSLDIDEEKRNIEKLKVEKEKFQQLFDNSSEGITILESDGKIRSVNRRFTDIFDYSKEEVKDKFIYDLITPPTYEEQVKKNIKEALRKNHIMKESIRRKRTGEEFYVNIHAFSITLEDGRLGVYVAYKDISERKQREEYIEYLSFHDKLTGLYNRRYFESEIDRLNNTRKLPLGIIVGDMNGLKYINDTYGHSTGDKYLIYIAKVLKSQLRSEDIIARVGGDEFAILLPNANTDICENIIKRIKRECEKYSKEEDFIQPLDIALGYALKNKTTEDLEKVFNAADHKMYKNKNNY